MRRRRGLLLLLPLAALPVPGCKMIDQRTFQRAPQGPTAAALSRPVLPTLPFLRLSLGAPGADWRAAVDQAMQAATAHNPDAIFDVLAPIPVTAKREVQDRYATQGQADAEMVADALQHDGVNPTHINLGYEGDAGTPPREVRVYVH